MLSCSFSLCQRLRRRQVTLHAVIAILEYATKPFCKCVVARMLFSRQTFSSDFKACTLWVLCKTYSCGGQKILDHLESHMLLNQTNFFITTWLIDPQWTNAVMHVCDCWTDIYIYAFRTLLYSAWCISAAMVALFSCFSHFVMSFYLITKKRGRRPWRFYHLGNVNVWVCNRKILRPFLLLCIQELS